MQDAVPPPAPPLPSEGGAWIISGTELVRDADPAPIVAEPVPASAPDTPEKEA